MGFGTGGDLAPGVCVVGGIDWSICVQEKVPDSSSLSCPQVSSWIQWSCLRSELWELQEWDLEWLQDRRQHYNFSPCGHKWLVCGSNLCAHDNQESSSLSKSNAGCNSCNHLYDLEGMHLGGSSYDRCRIATAIALALLTLIIFSNTIGGKINVVDWRLFTSSCSTFLVSIILLLICLLMVPW